jgi:hypothetical protein
MLLPAVSRYAEKYNNDEKLITSFHDPGGAGAAL